MLSSFVALSSTALAEDLGAVTRQSEIPNPNQTLCLYEVKRVVSVAEVGVFRQELRIKMLISQFCVKRLNVTYY